MEPIQTTPGKTAEFQTTDGIPVSYRIYGDDDSRTPVVCLHGYWRTSRDFEELAAHLASRRRVIVLDLRGRGKSGRSTDPTLYAFERLCADVEGIMAACRIERAVIVGLALGAQIAMELAANRPALVAGIVFNDSAPESNAASGRKMASFAGADALSYEEAMARVKAQYETAFPRMDEQGFRRLLYRNYLQDDDGLYVRDFDQLTNDALYKTLEEHPTFWPEYDRIADIPIAVLRGENSDFISGEIVARMVAGRILAKPHTIPGTGHPAMLWEQESFAAIDALLEDVDLRQQ